MKRAIFPGSFNPFTVGHFDILEQACKLFDEIYVVQFRNPDKAEPEYSFKEYKNELVHKCKVFFIPETQKGLLVKYCQDNDIRYVIRGIRNVQDYEYELKQMKINVVMDSMLTYVFLQCNPTYENISSTVVRDILKVDKVKGNCLVYNNMDYQLSSGEK